jgi:hypothetical protein
MAPWDEPSSRNCCDSTMAFLQMEKEKVANKAAKEMMNHIRELFLALEYEESHQEENTMSCDPSKKTLMILYSMTSKVKKYWRKTWKASKELFIKDQASCDEETMEGCVHKKKEEL